MQHFKRKTIATFIGLLFVAPSFVQAILPQDSLMNADMTRSSVQKIAVKQAAMALASETSDADNDGYAEAPVMLTGAGGPNGGGLIPLSSSAPKDDSYGGKLGYCSWDNGSVNSSSGRIAGQVSSQTAPVLAVISAGVDGVFQTSCSDIAAGTGAKGDDYVISYNNTMIQMGVGGTLYFGDPVTSAGALASFNNGGIKDGQVRLNKANDTLLRWNSATQQWSGVTSYPYQSAAYGFNAIAPLSASTGNAVALTPNSYYQMIGAETGLNLIFDTNTIQSRNGAYSSSVLRLNPFGGESQFGGQVSAKTALKLTDTSGEQRFLIGNQDSLGYENPAILSGANGNILFGTGSTWANSGGVASYYAQFAPTGITFSAPLNVNGALHIGESNALPATTTSGVYFSYSYPTTRAYIGDGTGWDFRFSARRNGLTSDVAVMTDTGKFGIGVMTPQYSIDVNSQDSKLLQLGYAGNPVLRVTKDSAEFSVPLLVNGAAVWTQTTLKNVSQLTNDRSYLSYTPVLATSGGIDSLTIPGFYNYQLAFSTRGVRVSDLGGKTGIVQETFDYLGNYLFRNKTDNTTFTPWKTIWHSENLSKVSQLPNDAGYIGKSDVGIVAKMSRYDLGDGTSINNAFAEHGFDYNTAGSGVIGPFLSFGQLGSYGNGNRSTYQTQLIAAYNNDQGVLKFRTQNGDNGGSWSGWHNIYHDGSPSIRARSLGISDNSGTGSGITLYGDPPVGFGLPAYGISFAKTSSFGGYGTVQRDWATYFTLAGPTNSGWIFQNNWTSVASIDAGGNATFNGNVSSGRMLANASGMINGASQNIYDIGAGRIGAGQSIYSYGLICAGNANADCSAQNSGTVISPTGITIGSASVLTSGNVNNYAPSLSGVGATGTWGISVTGSASSISSLGRVDAYTTSAGASGLSFGQVYGNGYPSTYGNVLNMNAGGAGQLLIGWSGTTGAHADNYIRSLRDSAQGTNGWSPWAKIVTDANIGTVAPYAMNLNQNLRTTDAVTFANLTINGQFNTSRIYANSSGAIGGAAQSVYDIGAGRIAAGQSIYSYGLICAGNYSGDCSAVGSGTVISPSGINIAGAAVLTSANFSNYAPTLSGAGASGTWNIDISGRSANASIAQTVNNSGVPMTFNWSGQSGQPTWLWGGNDQRSMYVYNPSNFNVNSAKFADLAYSINITDSSRNANSILPNQKGFTVRYDFVTSSTTGQGGNYSGLMTMTPYTGTTASTGDGSYQLAFGSSGTNATGIPQLNIRTGIDNSWNNWYTIWHSGNLNPQVNAQPNSVVLRDSGGYINGNYINMSDEGVNGSAGTVTAIITKRGDNYYRSTSAASIKTFLNYSNADIANALGYTPVNKSGDSMTGNLTAPRLYATASGNAGNAINSYYDIGAGRIAAGQSIYSYGTICVGNNSGDCSAPNSGTVITSSGINIGGASVITSNSISSYAPSLTGTGASGTWNINITGAAANASIAQTVNNSGNPMSFYWSGQSGQPTWLWGGNDPNSMFVYNPSNFSVNYANSAGTLTAWATLNEIQNNGWYRSNGQTGWYNTTYGGGMYMTDSTWVRTFASRSLWSDSIVGAGLGINVNGRTVIDQNQNAYLNAVIASNYIQPGQVASNGGGCSITGAIGRDAAGNLFVCN